MTKSSNKEMLTNLYLYAVVQHQHYIKPVSLYASQNQIYSRSLSHNSRSTWIHYTYTHNTARTRPCVPSTQHSATNTAVCRYNMDANSNMGSIHHHLKPQEIIFFSGLWPSHARTACAPSPLVSSCVPTCAQAP